MDLTNREGVRKFLGMTPRRTPYSTPVKGPGKKEFYVSQEFDDKLNIPMARMKKSPVVQTMPNTRRRGNIRGSLASDSPTRHSWRSLTPITQQAVLQLIKSRDRWRDLNNSQRANILKRAGKIKRVVDDRIIRKAPQ